MPAPKGRGSAFPCDGTACFREGAFAGNSKTFASIPIIILIQLAYYSYSSITSYA
jgi:hypothetical protein